MTGGTLRALASPALLALGLSLIAVPRESAATPTATVTVDPNIVTNPSARRLLGTSFDSRTGIQSAGPGGTTIPSGYYDINGQLLPGIAPLWARIHLTTLRYPGNGVDQIDWRQTIGPIASRVPQLYAGNSFQTQVIRFGFDDFMAMVATHNPPGEAAPEVQIMVSTDTSVTVPTQAAIIQMAADWVEYANAPNDSSNRGGGTDWAALRAANGHPPPYNIRIWNVGNEPWGPTQAFNFNVPGNAAAFAAFAQPIIAAMKAIDPTIQITVPSAAHPLAGAVDNAAQAAWDNTMLSQLGGQLFGLSEHIFYDASTARGVTASAGSVSAVLARIAASAHPDVKLLLGDQAHSIAASPTPAQADFAMQWQAALTSADFLLMLAGKPIELANFWIYGSTQSTWHPIRRNSNGSYTLMPVGALYAELGGSLQDRALATTTVSPASLDGTAGYSVRAGAFRAADGSALTLVAVNRDTLATQRVVVQGLSGWGVQRARLFTASGAAADAFAISTLPLASADAEIALPPGSVVCVEYVPALTAVPPGAAHGALAMGAPMPNPARHGVTIALAPAAATARFAVHDVRGRIVRQLPVTDPGRAILLWDLRDDHETRVPPGVYFIVARWGAGLRSRRVIVER